MLLRRPPLVEVVDLEQVGTCLSWLSSEAPAQLCELGAWSLLLFLLLTCSLPGLQLLVH